MATGKTEKRDRQPNWTSREEIRLIESYIEPADVIEGEFGGCGIGGISASGKDRAWGEIKECLNSISVTLRTQEQLKKKVAAIKCSALKKNRRNLQETGGGKGVILSEAESLMIKFLTDRNSSCVSGISTGTDIGFSTASCSAISQPEMLSLTFDTEPVDEDIGDLMAPVSSACGSNDIYSLLNKAEREENTPRQYLSTSKQINKKKRKSEEDSLYSEFLRENIKLLKLKQKKIELEIKKMELEQ